MSSAKSVRWHRRAYSREVRGVQDTQRLDELEASALDPLLSLVSIERKGQKEQSVEERLEALSAAQLLAAQELAQASPGLSALDALQSIFCSAEHCSEALADLGLSPGREAIAYWDSAADLAKLGVLRAQADSATRGSSAEVLKLALDQPPAFI